MKQLFFFVVILSSTINIFGQSKETFAFVERDSTLYLDVYKPEVCRPDKAAVVSLFGGGFISGTRHDKHQQDVAKVLTERGFTVICIDYRLGMNDKNKAEEYNTLLNVDRLFKYCIDIAVEDCSSAIAWVVSHADELDIDPTKIVLTGASAGAITVLQMDYCRANALPEASALPDGWMPAAVVPYACGIMCKRKDLHYDTAPAPTMLMHGNKDKLVTYKSFGIPFHAKLFGSKKVDKHMRKQNIPHWFITFTGIGHEVAGWLPSSVELFCAFVDQTLAGRVTNLTATMTDTTLVPTKWTTMGLFDLYMGKDKLK